MLNKVKHKTRLTQNKKAKHTSNAYKKKKKRERKVTKSLRAFFLPHLIRTFPFDEPLIRQWGGRIETVQIQKEYKDFGFE